MKSAQVNTVKHSAVCTAVGLNDLSRDMDRRNVVSLFDCTFVERIYFSLSVMTWIIIWTSLIFHHSQSIVIEYVELIEIELNV
jgi:hypothetical protein